MALATNVNLNVTNLNLYVISDNFILIPTHGWYTGIYSWELSLTIIPFKLIPFKLYKTIHQAIMVVTRLGADLEVVH